MYLKPRNWLLLSLLLLAGGVCLWRAGDRVAASRHGLGPALVSSASSVPLVPLVPSAGLVGSAAGARPSYRLSNTAESAAALARNPHGLLLRNALIDTALPVRLAIPEGLRSHGAPGSYLVQSDRPLNGEFYAALARDGAKFVSYMPVNAALVEAGPEAGRAIDRKSVV